MRTSLSALAQREYDLVIVGGGIFGACAAWDAALRGLGVALVERGDFAHATSGHCFKMVHGGFRYLQHGDLPRVRESSRERGILLRIAPHLVHPLPIVVPTYGYGLRSKPLLWAGLTAYDLLTFDRNHGIRDPAHRVPPGRLLSRGEALSLFPWLDGPGLTGAMVFHDGHMPSPARLTLAYLRSARKAGADVVNYAEAVDLLRRADAVCGIRARDLLTGDVVDIRGRMVLNAAGPWAEGLLRRWLGLRLTPALTFSRDAYFVVPGRLTGDYAVAVQGRTRDPDAILSRGRRHLFLVPWRDCTLIGVWHVVYRGDPDDVALSEGDLRGFLDEINAARLPFHLSPADVSMWHAGLVLFGGNTPGAPDLSYGKRSRLVDHARTHRVDGLVSMIGVRYTTSRGVAQDAIDLVFAKLGRRPPASATAVTPIHGGDIDRFDAFLREAVGRRPGGLAPEVTRALVYSYGSEYGEVLNYAGERRSLAETIGQSTVLKAQVVQAVRDEMAVKLADVVFRRTDLAGGRPPDQAALRTCAELMATELGWSEAERERQIADVQAVFPRPGAGRPRPLEVSAT